jgi:hypothetical protein
MITELTEENFVMYAMKHYDNPACRGMAEFEDDLKKFRYLKRLFRKYTAGKGLKERLIVNHIVVLYNLFGPEAATRMLFFKVEEKYWSQLKTFLVYLSIMPVGFEVSKKGVVVQGFEIPLDEKVSNALREI